MAWYAARDTEIGARFLGEVDHVLTRMSRGPNQFPLVHGESVRRALLRHFPYAVYFRTDATHATVLAVVHQRRDEAFWKNRR